MELFVPGLIVLLVSAFFIFLILPRMGSMVLAIASLVALIAVGVHHYSQFYSEYRLSTWQNTLTAYAPWVTLGFALIAMVSSIIFFVSGEETRGKIANAVSTPMEAIQDKVAEAAAAMPSAASATNAVTAGINNIIKNTTTTNASAQQPQAQAQQPNARRNNTVKSPNIPGAGFSASGL
jgi:hypothetical protein